MIKLIATIFSFFPVFIAFSGDDFLSISKNPLETHPLRLPKINITKSGPYIGVQRGRFTLLEIGGERQWKQIKLIKPTTHAASLGANYNFKYNVIGFDLGYWFKRGRLDLTYGANLVYRSDFDSNSFGLAPVIGYKIFQFHIQAGYHFLTKPKYTFETNTLFVSLRFVLINSRDVDIKREKKKKK